MWVAMMRIFKEERRNPMTFTDCFETHSALLMEGALGERLKREYRLKIDGSVGMAGLVYTASGRHALKTLWKGYAGIARDFLLPFLATTPTRRVNRERLAVSRYSASILQDNMEFLCAIQQQQAHMYIGCLLGCRGDAYTGADCLTLEEARKFHSWEAALATDTDPDFLYAALMPTLQEAAGMALAFQETKIPYLISFTILKNGCLVDGTPLSSAIRIIDELTETPPICYMTNCVHPEIVYCALSHPFNRTELVRQRFLGIQANTSRLSYAQLDHSKDLKTSDPEELAQSMVRLRDLVPLKIFGGCCGTDDTHIRKIVEKISC